MKVFTKEWEVFVKCVVGLEHLPDWSTPWDDFTQEEIWEGSKSNGQKGDGVDRQNVALVAKRKSKKQGSSGKGLRKVICFVYN